MSGESVETTSTARPRVDPEIRACRMAVLVGAGGVDEHRHTVHQVDLSMPIDIPIGSLIADIVPMISTQLSDQGLDVSMFSPSDKDRKKWRPWRWTLSEVGAPPMAADKTLEDLGVGEGARLALTRAHTTEVHRVLVDDVTDAAAVIGKQRIPLWTEATSLAVGAAMAVAGGASAALLVGLYALGHRSDWSAPMVLLLAAIATLAAAWVADHRYQASVMCRGLVLSAYPLAGVGGAAIVPGSVGPFQLILAAGALMTVAVVDAAVLQRVVTLDAALITIGVIAIGGAGTRAFFAPGMVAIGAGTTLASLLALSAGAKWAVMAARMPLPPIPTMGIDVREPDPSPKFIVAGSPGAEKYMAPSAKLFERRAVAAHLYAAGLVIGAAVCVVAGTALTTVPGHRRYWLAFALSLMVAFVVIRKARIVASRLQGIVLMAAGASIVVSTAIRYALADGRLVVVIVVAVLLLALSVLAALAGAVLPGMPLSYVQRRVWELVEMLLWALVVPIAVWIADVFGVLRGIR